MRIRIEAHHLPGRHCGPGPEAPDGRHHVHVGRQRKGRPDDLLDVIPGDAAAASWTIEVTAVRSTAGIDLKGPYVEGRPGQRFLYLSWVDGETEPRTMFRRAKLQLDAVPPALLEKATDDGVLVGRVSLSDAPGDPRCASVRPPLIEWSTARAP